ncbi:unnamed protein product [Arabidopsis arenosa]|uniref:Uncharacterized protein n=1 Tax=Arabidopsis arenosa TaxID=38785 RepID=A0A8S2A2F6_ARAAE|nr:unnamed protein product [Arabidopsis arenosa]
MEEPVSRAAEMGARKHWEIIEDWRGVEGGADEKELLRMRARPGDPVALAELVETEVVNSPENRHVTGKRGPPKRSNLRSKLQSQEEAAGGGTPVKGAHSIKLWVILVFVSGKKAVVPFSLVSM